MMLECASCRCFMGCMSFKLTYKLAEADDKLISDVSEVEEMEPLQAGPPRLTGVETPSLLFVR